MINSTGNLCPVKVLQNYFNFSLTNNKSEEYIFRAIKKIKTTEKLQNVKKPLSYTKTRVLLVEALVDIWIRKNDFGLPSLHSSRVTLVAYKGVKDRLFKRYCRWKSENVKDGYIEDNLESLLVIKSSGL